MSTYLPLSEAPDWLGQGSPKAGHPSRHHRAAMGCSGGGRKHLTHHIRLRGHQRLAAGKKQAQDGGVRGHQDVPGPQTPFWINLFAATSWQRSSHLPLNLQRPTGAGTSWSKPAGTLTSP